MTQAVSFDSATPNLVGLPAARWWRWMLLAVALVAAGVYANSLWNGFALDDIAIVKENEQIKSLEWAAIWKSNYWPAQDGASPDILYRPLTIWSYLATQALADGATWAYHLGNVLLHALATVMASVLAWRIFGNRAVAIITGLFFALHPIHTEAVANIVGRAELLSTMFSLAALLVFLPDRPLLLEREPDRRGLWHGWLVAACFMLAMLSKETPAALLGGFVFIDFWRWSHFEKQSRPALVRWFARQTLCYYVPLAVAFAAYMAMRINACGIMQNTNAIHPIVNPLVTATFAERLITPFAILSKYLALMVWPKVLSADYSFPSLLPTSNPMEPMPLVGILLTLLSLIVTVRAWKKAPHVVLTLWLFACSYALAANFIRIGTIMGERLFYLPSLFVIMLAAWGLVVAMQKLSQAKLPVLRLATASLVAVACVAMSVRTFIRNQDWRDNLPLALATAHGNLESSKACFWAGFVIASEAPEPWMRDFGAELLKRSIELCPQYGRAYFELAKHEGRKGRLGESMIWLAQAAQRSAGQNDVRAALIAVKNDLKNQAPENYMPVLEKYRDENPTQSAPRLALAVAYAAQGKLAEAEEACVAALTLDNRFHEAICELGHIRLERGELETGINALQQYVDHIPNNLESRCTLAGALMQLNREKYPRALPQARKCLEQAENICKGDAKVRELRAELVRREAGLPMAPRFETEVQGPTVSMAPAGGQR